MAEPFLKWAGGKTQLLEPILDALPGKIRTYFEPFIGGGAVCLELENWKRFDRAVIGDSSAELVNVYRAVRDDVEELIRVLSEMRTTTDEETYYEVRAIDPEKLAPTKRAARTIYLNKLGYNGMYRVNRRGVFNIPYGRYKRPKIFDAAHLREAARALQGVEIVKGDFADLMVRAGPGDAIYCDPPYAPVSKTANFRAYQKAGFGEADHRRLVTACLAALGRGAAVVISNSDCEFTRDLYTNVPKFEVRTVQARRSINSKGSKRGKISELLVVGQPESAISSFQIVETPLTELEVPEEDSMAVRKKKKAATTTTAATEPKTTTVVDDTVKSLDAFLNSPSTPDKAESRLSPFTELRTNMKGLNSESPIKLGAKTAIIGRTRTGKTSVAYAYKFALTGALPGRTSDYVNFYGGDGDNVFSVLTSTLGRLGSVASRGSNKIERNADSPYLGLAQTEADKLVIPITSLGGDKTERETIFKRFGGEALKLQGVPTPEGISGEQKVLWNNVINEIWKETSDPIEVLGRVPEHLRSKARADSDRIREQEQQLEEARAAAAEAVDAFEQLPKLEEQYKAAVVGESLARLAPKTAPRLEELEEFRRMLGVYTAGLEQIEAEAEGLVAEKTALAEAEAAFKQLEATDHEELKQLNVKAAALDASLAPRGRKIERVKTFLEFFREMVDRDLSVCICNGECDPKALIASLEAILKRLEERGRDEYQEYVRLQQTIAARRNALETQRRVVENRRESFDDNKADLKRRHVAVATNIEMTKKALEAAERVSKEAVEATAPAKYSGPSSAALKVKIDTLKNGQAAKKRVDELQGNIRFLKNRQTDAKVLEGAAADLQQNLLESVTRKVLSKANDAMPKGYIASLDLDDGACEWRALGADDKAHGKASVAGTEKATLLVARAITLAEESPFRALSLDDDVVGPFHSSPGQLADFLSTIGNLVDEKVIDQLLVAGLRREEVPADWTIVDLEA